jgi:hypothetical protein
MFGWMHWLLHAAWPMPEAKPGAQFEHDEAPAAEYVPAEQATHVLKAIAPVALDALPAGHKEAPPGVPTLPVPVQ